MLYNSKGYINAVEKVVKSLKEVLCFFPCSYVSEVKNFFWGPGPVASENQLNHPKMRKNQKNIPVQ